MVRWTREENELVATYSNDREKLRELLPHRTREAIRKRLDGEGAPRRRRWWTTKDIREVRAWRSAGMTWPQIQALKPGMSHTVAIRYGANTPPPRALKPLGVPVLDSIRQRATARGLSLSSLDRAIGSRCGYFNKSYPIIYWRQVVAAVEHLDGSLKICWDDLG